MEYTPASLPASLITPSSLQAHYPDCDTQSREKVNILASLLSLEFPGQEGEEEATWGVMISMKNHIVMGPGLWVSVKTNPMPSGHT